MEKASNPWFEEEFDGFIWRLIPNQNSIFLEIREEKELIQHWLSLDMISGEIVKMWMPKQVTWWTSVLAVSGDYLAYHAFEDQQNPGPGNLTIINTQNHGVISEISDFLLDAQEPGHLIGTISQQGEMRPTKIPFGNADISLPKVLSPIYFPADEESFSIVSKYVQRFNHQAALGAEYLELDDTICFTYYVKSGTLFDRYLCWIKKGQTQIHRCIDTKMRGLALESFITFQDRLIFVENRNKLVLYEM